MIILKDITMDNFIDVIKLPQTDEDKKMVASNLFSIAEAYADKVSQPKAIYVDHVLVGFIMYDYNVSERKAYISRLMITSIEQGKGYGTEALRIIIEEVKRIKDCTVIQISYHPNNEKARKSYKKVGFIESNDYIDGEIIAYMKLTS